jgi:DNA mismatch repair protein MutL
MSRAILRDLREFGGSRVATEQRDRAVLDDGLPRAVRANRRPDGRRDERAAARDGGDQSAPGSAITDGRPGIRLTVKRLDSLFMRGR